MNGPLMPAYLPGRHSAHLVGGDGRSLCGAHPRPGRRWLGGRTERQAGRLASLPACRSCALQARVAEAIAEATAPARRPGVIARVRTRGKLVPVAECVRCGKVRPAGRRGLCDSCYRITWAAGTTGDYGWTRADRLPEFARLRGAGLSVAEAAARVCVTDRTGWRYEQALRGEAAA